VSGRTREKEGVFEKKGREIFRSGKKCLDQKG